MIKLSSIQNTLIAASRRSDIVVAAFIMVAIVMMIIPLPTFVIDLMITLNVSASVVILLVTFYVARPIDFSALPSVLLITTLFRLALSISTTRLILLDANAGDIIASLGNFVIGGNIAVGIVIFLIISVAQFIVIAKGAERVAEVAARFSLDGMPGKQMSIDNDLRNGDITQAEARNLRRLLEKESQLYGAMDGAMKFVKGDAIATLIIIVINMIGGLAIGMAQRDMSFADAGHTYTLLTIGEGLIAQIPALIICVAAGTIVTRVSSAESLDLGSDISAQTLKDPRVLGIAAFLIFALGFIPGFPTAIFLTLAALLGVGAFLLRRRIIRAEAESKAAISDVAVVEAKPERSRHQVQIYMGENLAAAVPQNLFQEHANLVRQDFYNDLGVQPPAIEIRSATNVGEDQLRIDLAAVPVVAVDIPSDRVLLRDDQMHLDLLTVPYEEGAEIAGLSKTIWIEKSYRGELERAGIGFLDTHEIIGLCLAHMLRRYAANFIGIQETRDLIGTMEQTYSELVKEAQQAVPLQKIADVLRRLVEEQVSIRHLRIILEALAESAGEKDVAVITERVRTAMKRQISFRWANANRVIPAFTLERRVEDLLRTDRPVPGGSTSPQAETNSVRPIIEQIRAAIADTAPEVKPVILTTPDARRNVRNVLARNDIDLAVLSYQELAPEFNIQTISTIQAAAPTTGSEARTPAPETV
ncbi:EscV/YscV/HrcV family type III secretion system export apparatus protein [Agaricicola taiwanensis]|uniref:EscV/YscV/HrcV family type III secretion system export apparatus protein n=1 Tax=Agaricicola taiwanensis TaxID=591372 RepID=A0A8J2YC87_9RHOB|nr:type III secretion system export apparatus subunit SctV [Agaricicola taiwanensis]GGE36027.1 EscV/YscV/HrcV family type III secretion system export apparatus protein [Agaricicola taiwanensis]